MNDQLRDYLHQRIPIAKAMGVEVKHASPDRISLFAPCANNINHKRTVFGGSLHAIATLACWSLVHVNLHPTGPERYHIVIAKSDVSYHAPVDSDFTVECVIPEEEAWKRFLKMLDLKKKGRVQLSAQVIHNNKLCVEYQASFAAIVA